jgi:hypothetical protein
VSKEKVGEVRGGRKMEPDPPSRGTQGACQRGETAWEYCGHRPQRAERRWAHPRAQWLTPWCRPCSCEGVRAIDNHTQRPRATRTVQARAGSHPREAKVAGVRERSSFSREEKWSLTPLKHHQRAASCSTPVDGPLGVCSLTWTITWST